VVFCIADLIASFQCLGKWCYCITKVSCFQTAAKLLQNYMLVVFEVYVISLMCSRNIALVIEREKMSLTRKCKK